MSTSRHPIPPAKLSDRQELESAITDAEGDMLLLDLAIEALTERISEHRPRGGAPKGETFTVAISEHLVTALTHAHCRLGQSIETVATTFHGEPQS